MISWRTTQLKMCNAAALALVGWYLIVPQLKKDYSVNSLAELAQWQIIDVLHSQTECNRWQAFWNSDKAWRFGRNSHPPMRAAFAKSLCVSASDPRIKGNPDIGHFESGHWKPYLDGRPN
jgi:hypothetical protein